MPNIFADSKICLSQAKKNILAFESRLKLFFKEKQYIEVTEHESIGKWVRKLKFTEPFIDDLADIATDVVDNLLSSLDYAWHSLAVASRAIPFSDEAKFPFADNVFKFEKAIGKGLNKFRPEIVALLRTFQPYKGGNDLLWALDRISAANRNELLAPIIILKSNLRGNIISMGEVTFPPSGWNRAKNEIVVFNVITNGITPLIDPDLKLPIEIIFDKVETVSNQPALAVLNKLASEVENIIEALEGAARVLGIIT